MKIYTVIAKRWGDTYNHSYLVGNYSTKDLARVVALAEECRLAGRGRYPCAISEFTLDKVDSDVINAYLQDTGEDE